MNAPAENLSDVADAEADLIAHMAELAEAPEGQRHAALVEWARSDLWSPVLMLCTGWHGQLARDAWKALQHDLALDTPAKRWNDVEPSVGRASIARLLGLEGSDFAAYAAAPFRTITDDDGRAWIAGAVGCMPMLDAQRLLHWRHTDISDVLLWDPRTGEGRVAGEHPSTSHLILPDVQDDRMTVFGYTGAFFRAWAGRRARTAALAQKASRGEWAHPVVEARDGGLPGALIVGDIANLQWRGVTASNVVAGAGVSKDDLSGAALRAAHLPRFSEDVDARG